MIGVLYLRRMDMKFERPAGLIYHKEVRKLQYSWLASHIKNKMKQVVIICHLEPDGSSQGHY